jgi:hypothetical protein
VLVLRYSCWEELNPTTKLWDVLVDPARKIRIGNNCTLVKMRICGWLLLILLEGKNLCVSCMMGLMREFKSWENWVKHRYLRN